MKIHLVTYATPRFRLRQWVLGVSARLNGVVDTVTPWTPNMLLAAGFEERCKDIKLSERGSGFWAWKPFIIQKKLAEIPVGDIVFYCDVGRIYPFKKLEVSIAPLLEWMEIHEQTIMPGLQIPWKGPMSMWTKRLAFVRTHMDHTEFHRATPIQASFSLWKCHEKSRAIVDEWMNLSKQRDLISDDPDSGEVATLPDFHENRHDQSLLSLCCLKHGITGIDIGTKMPNVDSQHPTEIIKLMEHFEPTVAVSVKLFRALVAPLEWIERSMRKNLKFGESRVEPDYTNYKTLS